MTKSPQFTVPDFVPCQQADPGYTPNGSTHNHTRLSQRECGFPAGSCEGVLHCIGWKGLIAAEKSAALRDLVASGRPSPPYA